MFIVTDEPSEFPDRRMMVGSGYIINNGPEEVAKREPTDRDMRIISTKEARRLFGTFANRLDGVTVSPCYQILRIVQTITLISLTSCASAPQQRPSPMYVLLVI
jgi:hypothetical protein